MRHVPFRIGASSEEGEIASSIDGEPVSLANERGTPDESCDLGQWHGEPRRSVSYSIVPVGSWRIIMSLRQSHWPDVHYLVHTLFSCAPACLAPLGRWEDETTDSMHRELGLRTHTCRIAASIRLSHHCVLCMVDGRSQRDDAHATGQWAGYFFH